jgi:hypothetical protein
MVPSPKPFAKGDFFAFKDGSVLHAEQLAAVFAPVISLPAVSPNSAAGGEAEVAARLAAPSLPLKIRYSGFLVRKQRFEFIHGHNLYDVL